MTSWWSLFHSSPFYTPKKIDHLLFHPLHICCLHYITLLSLSSLLFHSLSFSFILFHCSLFIDMATKTTTPTVVVEGTPGIGAGGLVRKNPPERPKALDADAKKAAADALKAEKAAQKAAAKALKDAKKLRAKEREKRVKTAERTLKKALTVLNRATAKFNSYEESLATTTKTGKALDRLNESKDKADDARNLAQSAVDDAEFELQTVKETVQAEIDESDLD
jgi:hypothetical protein